MAAMAAYWASRRRRRKIRESSTSTAGKLAEMDEEPVFCETDDEFQEEAPQVHQTAEISQSKLGPDGFEGSHGVASCQHDSSEGAESTPFSSTAADDETPSNAGKRKRDSCGEDGRENKFEEVVYDTEYGEDGWSGGEEESEDEEEEEEEEGEEGEGGGGGSAPEPGGNVEESASLCQKPPASQAGKRKFLMVSGVWIRARAYVLEHASALETGARAPAGPREDRLLSPR